MTQWVAEVYKKIKEPDYEKMCKRCLQATTDGSDDRRLRN